MKSWAPKQKGFTVVELLIVIIVIAILAAISVVVFNGMKARAIDSGSKQRFAEVNKAILRFNADKGRYPTITEISGAPGAQLLGLTLEQTQPLDFTGNQHGYVGISGGWASSSYIDFRYVAGPDCHTAVNDCTTYLLTYWSTRDNAQVSYSGG